MKMEGMIAGFFLCSALLLAALAMHVHESERFKEREQEREMIETDDAVEWVKNYLSETTPFQ